MDDYAAKSVNYAIMRTRVQNPAPAGQPGHSANVCDSTSSSYEMVLGLIISHQCFIPLPVILK